VKRLTIIAAVAALLAPAAAVAAGPNSAQQSIQLTPVLRVPFPERGYVVDLPKPTHLTSSDVRVTENGVAVHPVTIAPVSTTGLRSGVVLAIDSSNSMQGKPYQSALAAAQTFLANRPKNERVGIVAFNSKEHVLEPLTLSQAKLQAALAHPPALAEGTHIFDGIDTSLAALNQARISSGAIILLTDGSDVGSLTTLSAAVKRARAQHVRVFTVGLKSSAFDPKTLTAIASDTGGSFAVASSPRALNPIYAALGSRLANEYLLQYRSPANENSNVVVRVSVAGNGSQTTAYVSPKASGLPPYHRPFETSFFLSTGSLLLLALVIAGIVVWVIRKFAATAPAPVTARVAGFTGPATATPAKPSRERKLPARPAAPRRAKGALSGLDRMLEIADIRISAAGLVALSIAGTVLAFIILVLISPVLFPLAFTVPLIPRAVVRNKLKRVRYQFSEQLSSNLQVLASALRAGHSFTAALASVVEQSSDPSQRELRRAVSDEQLGMPIDEAIRRVAERMQSRDLEQVALVAELQRTTGGNVAEVLDVVVATIRDRQDVRRMIRTLTAQGRMARWILTGLPIFTGLAFYAIQPHIAGPFYASTVGKVVLLFASLSVITGSLLIQKVIEIDV
jgi:tight adherence protein B